MLREFNAKWSTKKIFIRDTKNIGSFKLVKKTEQGK